MTSQKSNNSRGKDDFQFNDLEAGERDDLSLRSLKELQTNILSSTTPIRSKQTFLRFPDTHSFRKWFTERAPEATDGRASRTEHTNVYFTSAGLRKLGVPPNIIESMDEAFCRGALSPITLAKLRDDTSDWGSHAKEWDVVVVCNALHNRLDSEIPAFAQSEDCLVEHGTSLGEDLKPLDMPQDARFGHFGDRDGISNPVYTQKDYTRIAKDHVLERYDPRHAMSTLLIRDPLSDSDHAFGSYLVFRKYRQDVAAFHQRVQHIAQEILNRRKAVGDTSSAPMGAMGAVGAMGHLGPVALGDRFEAFRRFETGEDPEGLSDLIHQWVMGRTRDGRVAAHLAQGHTLNGFNYDDDLDGKHCPFHAHVRKVNPRGLSGDLELERRTAIARRGISYINPLDDQDRGLLFWCAQSSIAAQFEYIQQKWVNADSADLSLRPTPDADALVGRIVEKPFEEVTNPYPPNTTRYGRWKSTIDVDFNIWDVVHLCGSSYVFAPSLTGLERLKAMSQ